MHLNKQSSSITGTRIKKYKEKQLTCSFWEPAYAIPNPIIAPILIEASSLSV
jgi:hypothetical protein